MAKFTINNQLYDLELIAFDKDGTIVDFNHMWGQRFKQWLTKLVTHVKGNDTLQQNLERSIGLNPLDNTVIPESPLAVATMAKISAAAMTVLYQHGYSWHEAEAAVNHINHTADTTIAPHLVKPIGDVIGAISRLVQQGVRIAVVTSDDRAMTESTLPLLGIEQYVDILVCGDDPFPNKPAPDGLIHISQQFGIPLNKIAMVGDTASDMVFGHNAGVACCVGITGGAGDLVALQKYADITVSSISEIW
jgi:phosphoglycolate phosphatase-like HAD superfamily hydrolase